MEITSCLAAIITGKGEQFKAPFPQQTFRGLSSIYSIVLFKSTQLDRGALEGDSGRFSAGNVSEQGRAQAGMSPKPKVPPFPFS